MEIEQAGVDLYRAPVDNERARTRAPLEARWKRIGLDHARRRLVEISTEPVARDSAEGTVLVVRSRIGLDGSALGADVTERWTGDGEGIDVDVTVTPSAFWPTDLPLPRIGWTFALPSAPDQVVYEGFGPHESYPDTGGGTTFSRWSSSLADLQVPYVFPQENGNRAGTVRATLTGQARPGPHDAGTRGPGSRSAPLVHRRARCARARRGAASRRPHLGDPLLRTARRGLGGLRTGAAAAVRAARPTGDASASAWPLPTPA